MPLVCSWVVRMISVICKLLPTSTLGSPTHCFHYSHHMIVLGSIMQVVSIFMLSLTRPYHFYEVFLIRSLVSIVYIIQFCIKVFLAQALGMGLSQALLFLPSLSILGQHFRQRRALAIGIATSVINFVPPPFFADSY